ncbi:cytokine receptor common subunit beta-like [Arapaima gigas]
MLFIWALCVSLLPLLVLTSEPATCSKNNVSAQYVSALMESLRCYNDYISHIRCTWTEDEAAHKAAPLSLHHIDQGNRESLCVPSGPPGRHLSGQLTVQCQYNTTLFAIGLAHTFFFKTPHSPAISKTIHLSENVRVGPPQGLVLNVTSEGNRWLSWKSPLPQASPWYTKLSYQVCYRRISQRWTTVDVLQMKWEIGAQSLVPGSRYEAMVRARSSGGPWSDWSLPVLWETEEAVGPRGPSNLQCLFDGNMTVTCSWDLSRDLAESVTYRLSYQTHPSAAAYWCCRVTHFNLSDSLLQFQCSFTVSGTEELLVNLTPEYNTKQFSSHTNIWLLPPKRVMVMRTNESWELRWTPLKISKVSVLYQVRFWSMAMQEDMEHWNITEGASSYCFHRRSLQPSTRYWAQVRAVIAPSSYYRGAPSEWTEPVEWITHPAPLSVSMFIYIFIGVLVTIGFFGLYFTLPAFHRKLISWEVSLPSPIKSKALKEVLKHPPNAWASSSQAEEAYICHVQILDGLSPSSCSGDTCWDATVDRYNSRSLSSLYKEKKDADTSNVSFNGPYLLWPKMSECPSDVSELAHYRSAKEVTSDSDSLSTTSELTLSLSEGTNGYVSLPSTTGVSPPLTLSSCVDCPFLLFYPLGSNLETQDCSSPALQSVLFPHMSEDPAHHTHTGDDGTLHCAAQ